MKKENIPILEVRELKVSFNMYTHGVKREALTMLRSLSLDVKKGEILAVVGSSGSGKSLLAHAILGILPGNATVEGSIRYDGEELTPKRQKKLRGTEIALIPQSVDYLDPLMRVGRQAAGVRGDARGQRAAFERYGLPETTGRLFPFQLSGGMARRVLISTAVTIAPRLIVADEPTPGLEASLAMDTLKHFRELADGGTSVLLITHDIDLALKVADRIAVFYAGTTVEVGGVDDFKRGKEALRHPYSRAFIDALPQNEFKPIAGSPPYAGKLPSGCLFFDRCPIRSGACATEVAMRPLRGGEVRCIHAT